MYPPLDTGRKEVRLLFLHGGEGKDIVSTHLSTGFLDAPAELKYEALSYVWGAGDLKVIEVNGQPFQVTVSLESALSHLRYTDKVCILWIDALCINQRDLTERNHQVAFMASIYEQALQVIAWLGKEEGGNDLAMHAVEELGKDISLHWLSKNPHGLANVSFLREC